MSVTVDHSRLETEQMGLYTLGQVLSHLQQKNRLVVNLLIDGREPDMEQIQSVRKFLVMGKTVYIETAAPVEIAVEVLDNLQAQLGDAEEFKIQAAELLQQNQVARAMEKLGVYFTTWQSAQESVVKTSQLLKINLEKLAVGSQSIAQTLAEFTIQLRDIRQTLMQRDYVLLTDLLIYETAQTHERWLAVLDTLRQAATASDDAYRAN